MAYILLIISDCFHTEYITSVVGERCLDAALEAWADPDNHGCVIVAELPDGTTWHFNPAQHPRFVHGPVQEVA